MTPPPVTPPAPVWKDAFVGSAACKKCHFQEAKAWSKSPLAKSLDALRPTPADDAVRFDRKKRAGLDPARDYSADPTCLACHTTGYGGDGGYPAGALDSTAARALATTMGSVSCEACHGPGVRFVAYKIGRIGLDSNAKFTAAELTAQGLVIPDAASCLTCHNDRSPTHADDPFDFEVARTKVHPVKK